MDRLAVTVTFFFFLLFSSTTFAIALGIIDNTDAIIDKTDATAIDTKQNDAIVRDLSRNFPDPETKSNEAIFLPSSESKPVTFVDWKPINKFPVYDDAAAGEQSTEPETIINFVPINRRFGSRSPVRTMRPFGLGHRCRHHHHQMLKPLGPGFRGREVSYGDDMLISGGIKGMGPDPMFRGGVRQIPARWVRSHREGTRFPNLRKPMPMRPREDEEIWEKAETEPIEILSEQEKNYEEEHHHDHHHHEKGWFMGRVGKFLNHF
ncbi:hypothetical protein HS088_TW20G00440 [Tripterygium wilfordii]|uniref:Uncharacterized protein n=1 Tax=Tripterygium wilfordii TaxID=458696 RepID=A0A7J7C7I8_TRIWF|nr:hypothetical protein HS088_TW20G00440 [Tripterygium wilfordii]